MGVALFTRPAVATRVQDPRGAPAPDLEDRAPARTDSRNRTELPALHRFPRRRPESASTLRRGVMTPSGSPASSPVAGRNGCRETACRVWRSRPSACAPRWISERGRRSDDAFRDAASSPSARRRHRTSRPADLSARAPDSSVCALRLQIRSIGNRLEQRGHSRSAGAASRAREVLVPKVVGHWRARDTGGPARVAGTPRLVAVAAAIQTDTDGPPPFSVTSATSTTRHA
jgi:hypothetical protein